MRSEDDGAGASGPRILMTADAVGGVWTYALELSQALGRRGATVALCTMGPRPSDAQRDDAARVDGLSLYESDYLLEWMDDPWDDVARAGGWLLDVASEVQPHVVHLNGYAHGALRFDAPALVVGHSCVLSWWEAVKGERAPARCARYQEAVAQGLRSAAAVVAPTRAMLCALERHYGPFPRGQVIHNARERVAFIPREKGPFILAAGRLWDEAKNVALLAEAAPKLPWPVRVAGDARHPGGGTSTLLGVEALGTLGAERLAEEMGHASIYALPARYEPFGLSALEAAQAGCALVLGDIPSLREVWGDAALFVSPDDAGALASALRRLVDAPELRASLAARARERARRYDAARMAHSYLDLYARVCGARGVTTEAAHA
jgi:glycogen(starch) synthase